RQPQHQRGDRRAAHEARKGGEPDALIAQTALRSEMAVVDLTLLRPSQNVIGSENLPELALRGSIACMQIGMACFDGSTEGRSDLVVVGFPRHAENVVKSLHLHPPNRWPAQQNRPRPNAPRKRIDSSNRESW